MVKFIRCSFFPNVFCYFLHILRAWKEKLEQAEKRKLEDIKELQVHFFSIGQYREYNLSKPCRRIRVAVRFGFLNALLLTDCCDFLEKFNVDT